MDERSLSERGLRDPATFRAALSNVPPSARDVWLDRVLGLGELPEDEPELPRGCVPYLPCSVEVLLRMIDLASVGASDVFVDIGSGPGRAAALVHLVTGASAIGIEIQPGLVVRMRALAARLPLSRIACVHGDAAELTGYIMIGSVFFLYCPFSGDRLAKVIADLESIAQTRMIRVCCVDLPPLAYPWLRLETATEELAIYRSV